jgi:hypothetical protein
MEVKLSGHGLEPAHTGFCRTILVLGAADILRYCNPSDSFFAAQRVLAGGTD